MTTSLAARTVTPRQGTKVNFSDYLEKKGQRKLQIGNKSRSQAIRLGRLASVARLISSAPSQCVRLASLYSLVTFSACPLTYQVHATFHPLHNPICDSPIGPPHNSMTTGNLNPTERSPQQLPTHCYRKHTSSNLHPPPQYPF